MHIQTALLLVLASVAVVAAAESDVLDLNHETFENAIKQHNLVMVEFYAPWCGHCKALAPEYEKAATAVKDTPIKFAKVNADEENNRPLAQQYGIRGFPTLKVFRNGALSNDYQGERKADAMVSFMKKQALPAVSQLGTTEEVEKFAKEDRVVVVSFGADGASEAFAAIAEKLRDKFLFGAAPASAAGHFGASSGNVVLFKAFDEGKNIFSGDVAAELEAFITKNSIPLVDEIGPNNYRNYMESGLPLAYLFVDLKVDGQKDQYVERIRNVAVAHKGKLNVVFIDWSKYAKHSERLGLSGTVVPSLAVEHEGLHYAYDEKADLTAENIEKWINSYLAGELKPTIKSEEIPADNSGPVKVAVAKNFDQLVLDASKHVLLEFYAPWCGHCKALVPTYEKLGEAYVGTDVVIAKIDATANDVDPKYGIRGFPTIKLFKAGDKSEPVEYQGDRSLDDLKRFIKGHTGVEGAASDAAADDSKDEL